MAIPKKNVVDLRKPAKEARVKKNAKSPAKKKAVSPAPQLYELRQKPSLIALAVTGVVLLALTVYFVLSKNYLASVLFVLAGTVMAIALFSKNKNLRPKKQIRGREAPESLTDIFSRILGL